MSTPRFHRLSVSDLRREASDAISMTFAIPDDLQGDYRFTPDQKLHNVEILEAIVRSADSGQEVTVRS